MTAALSRRLDGWRDRSESFESLNLAQAEARRRSCIIYARVKGWLYRVYPGGRTIQLALA